MNKVVITGALGQIGKKLVEVFARENMSVIAVDKSDFTSNQLENKYDVVWKKLDITEEDQVAEFFSQHRNVDVLINNAGVGVYTPWEQRTSEEFRSVLEVNLLGTFLMCKHSIEQMKVQGHGRIVNLGSIYGLKSSDERIYGESGRNNSEVYSISKAGVVMLTKYMAAHFGKYNIQTNCICPGGVFNNQDPLFVENYIEKTPAGRMGSPDDIAEVAFELCSKKFGYVNGQAIAVDGGFTAW